MSRRAPAALALLVTALGAAAPASAQICLVDAAPFVREEIAAAATALAGANPPSVTAFDTRLAVFAVIDGLLHLQVQRVQVMSETVNTDKQVGASASGSGTTSLLEQPSFAKLLALAIENGAVETSATGTQLTLSTSPYALVSAIAGDSAEVFQNYEWLARVGVSAGFDMDPGGANPLESVRQDQLREWSLRVRLTPDRGGRSAAFRDYWLTTVQPRVQIYANAVSANAAVATADRALLAARDTLRTTLTAVLATPRTDRDAIATDIACALQNAVAAPLASGALVLAPETLARLRAGAASFGASLIDLRDANALAEEYFTRVGGRPQATVALTQHRPVEGTSFVEGKFVYEQGSAAARLLLNVGGSIYQRPDPARNQGTLRDLSVALGLEGKLPNPFASGGADLSKTTLSLNGRFQRRRENDGALRELPDVSAVQVKIDIPLAAGLSLPLSLSVSNAADQVGEQKTWGSTVHVGLAFDADKFFALSRMR